MSTLKLRLLAGALAALAGPTAHAQTVLQGGGSTLYAPAWAQLAGCWDSDAGNGTYIKKGSPGLVITPTAITGCTPVTGTRIAFVAAGSGAGQAATFAHDGAISLFGTNPDYSGGKVFTSGGIQYGLSDIPLLDPDVGVSSIGTGVTYTSPGGRPVITTPATYQGLTFGAGSGLANDYPVARPKYGPLVQFPIAIVPIAIAYNPTYKPGFQLQLTDGVLKLDANAYCQIFAGAIDDWGDAALTALNGGVSLKDPSDTGSAPIKLVGDSASSGATSIFTRHLAAACDAFLASNPFTAGVTTLPAAVISLYTTVSGDSGVATAINNNAGAIGYISPSYVLPAVLNTGVNSYNLPAAQLQNASGAFIAPSGAAATDAFGAIAPPVGVNRADQTLWVQGTAKTVPIANPTDPAAYPIVGTTNFIGYSCYASVTSVTSLRSFFLNFVSGSQAATILSNAGLAQLPTNWLVRINTTFVDPTANNNLFFAEAGSGSNGAGRTNSNCTVAGVVGG